jgi:hypothetical protein
MPGCAWALLRFASVRPLEVNWQHACENRKNALDCVFRFLEMCRLIPTYVSRIKVQTSIGTYGRSVNLPMGANFTLRVAHAPWRHSVSRAAAASLSRFALDMPHWVQYCQRSTRTVLAQPAPWKQALMNVQRFCRNYRFNDSATVLGADLGLDMVRIPISSAYTPFVPRQVHEKHQRA